MAKWLKELGNSVNIVAQCRRYRVSIWSCPQFIFLVMGVIMIVAIWVTYGLAQRYTEPEAAAIAALILTGILFIIAHVLVASFEKVVNAGRAKSEFISIMSHQLRTPLTSMKWQFNLLNNDKFKIPLENYPEYFRSFERENERMIRLVNNLLEVNHIEDGSMVVNPTFFSITGLIDEVLGEYAPILQAAKIQAVVKKDGISQEIFADERKTRHIITSLLDNAITYGSKKAPDGNPLPSSIFFKVEEIDMLIRVEVVDEGMGITKPEQRRVFEKFFRSPEAFKFQPDGTGLSLYVAKSYIDAIGGKMGFSSNAHQGSTFWFTLPVTKRHQVITTLKK